MQKIPEPNLSMAQKQYQLDSDMIEELWWAPINHKPTNIAGADKLIDRSMAVMRGKEILLTSDGRIVRATIWPGVLCD